MSTVAPSVPRGTLPWSGYTIRRRGMGKVKLDYFDVRSEVGVTVRVVSVRRRLFGRSVVTLDVGGERLEVVAGGSIELKLHADASSV